MRMPLVDAKTRTAGQLERVLLSSLFVRSEQLSRLLRFLVNRHLENRDHELKESVIGVEVFGRKPDYNPKFDPIVRTEARRLRSRLSEYYSGEGKADRLVIEIPKGGYVPSFRQSHRNWHRGIIWYAIAAALSLAIVAAALKSGRHWPQSRSEAEVNDILLRARTFEMQANLKGVEESIGLFEQATAKAPRLAQAYAGVAAGEAARSAFDRFEPRERADMIAKGWAAAEKAVQLEPLSPEAQDGMGMMQAREAQWKQAERSFRRAVEIAPRDPLWHTHFALFVLLPLGRIGEAVSQLHTADEIDPISRLNHSALDLALRGAGRFDEAEFHCRRASENDREESRCWTQTLLRQGKTEQAIQILERTWSGHLLDLGAQALGVAYARAGRRTDAEWIAAMAPRPASKAATFAALGDKDRTFAALDEMIPMGPTRIGREIFTNPDFTFLRGDPRLKMLRSKVALPE